MAGMFEIYIDGKHIRDVELPGEIINQLCRWWYTTKRNGEFKIRCELEM